MADKKDFKLVKKKRYRVQCAVNAKHVFDKVFEVDESGEPKETEVETFCPICGEMVTIMVKGEPILNENLLRRFKEQDKRLGRK
jgi:hypothetical protein